MKKILFILSLFLWAQAAHAQLYSFKHYSLKEGLSQSVIQAMIQDRKGYFWFGTEDGLNRFDGLQFKQYGPKEGLSFTDVYTLASDAEDNIYIGTYGGGVFILDAEGKIRHHLFEGDSSHNTVMALMKGKDGSIFAVTQAGMIYRLKGEEVTPFGTDTSSLTSEIKGGAIDAQNNFWLVTSGDGLVHVQEDGLTRYGAKEGLKFSNLISVAVDSQGNVWIGTRGNGIIRFDGEMFHTFSDLNLPSPVIQTVYEAPDKTIWFGTEGGVCHLIKGKCENFTTANGLPVNAVNQVFQGREGHIWFGTFGGGVVQLGASQFVHYTEEAGLTANLVFAVGEGIPGEIYLGTDGGGVNVLKGDTIAKAPFPNDIVGNTIFSIMKDSRESLWIGSYTKGATRIRNGRYEKWTTAEGLPSDNVRSVYEDSGGNIWFATQKGLAHYSRESKKVTVEKDPMLQHDTSDILEDRSGHFWIGTVSDGVVRLTNGKSKQITAKEGLVNNHVYSIFEDRGGAVWFATKGGLSRWKDGALKNYTTKEGLSNNACYFITQDNQGTYWVGTNQGLNRFDGNRFEVYTIHDGLVTNEFNARAAYKDVKGNLWFGHIKGVTKLDPTQDLAAQVPPPVFLSQVMLHDEVLDLGKNADDLAYDQNYFNFYFVSPYFTSPESLQYSYILEGLDKKRHLSSLRQVQYTSLPPGRYTFRVRAEGKGGIESEDEATYSFLIHPPFWKTSWFTALAMLMFVSLVVGYLKYKTYQMKQKNAELEKLVEERTKQLKEEKEVSDRLICNILPEELVKELKETGQTKPRRYDNVTILFSDFKGFTTTAATLPPEFLVGELDSMFKAFDKIVKKHGLEKIKTIGDAYMAAGGLPKESKDHAIRCVLAAREMQEYMKERNKKSIVKWDMRVGIHSGTVVAGVVGDSKFTYDIWGDTVNIASRMEGACEPGRVNLSAFCYHLVKDKIRCEYRQKVEIKGKGAVDMYYL